MECERSGSGAKVTPGSQLELLRGASKNGPAVAVKPVRH